MFMFSALVVIATLSYVAYLVVYREKFRAFAQFPTPKKHFILGNSLEMMGVDNTSLLKRLQRWEKNLGEVFLFTIHPFDDGIVFISDPVIAETVSLHQPDRTRVSIYKSVARWIGHRGFFMAPTELSKMYMKPIYHQFHPKYYDRVKPGASDIH